MQYKQSCNHSVDLSCGNYESVERAFVYSFAFSIAENRISDLLKQRIYSLVQEMKVALTQTINRKNLLLKIYYVEQLILLHRISKYQQI